MSKRPETLVERLRAGHDDAEFDAHSGIRFCECGCLVTVCVAREAADRIEALEREHDAKKRALTDANESLIEARAALGRQDHRVLMLTAERDDRETVIQEQTFLIEALTAEHDETVALLRVLAAGADTGQWEEVDAFLARTDKESE